MSLDGYVTAPDADQEHGLGIRGEAIHAWLHEEPRSPVDEAVPAHCRRRWKTSLHPPPPDTGGGTRLFDRACPTTLVQRKVAESPRATHLTYEVVQDKADA
jgi:hypothetical protein